ncbi:iron hydrogenase [Sporanaerobium hydrogeniformans]|uniref:Iron hydrogenase n=2 Tax=Sporanaerobium hydrogeniformans TaxID=3072179 RepID=A0AC61DEF8_9FIRM|nr:iron hydrogenase [Sporanaerobium hydrogeniformans]
MQEKHQRVYKELIKAYYTNHFEETFKKILKEEFENKQEAKDVLSILCGVEDLEEEEDYLFTQKLLDAITRQQVRKKIVQKVRICKEDCEREGEKSKCQSVCPFDAIIRDGAGEKWIDESLCISCGCCVSVCEKGNYMETPQFLPLISWLKGEEKVIAIVAPAIAGQFGKEISLDQLREAFIKLGFADMVEVAIAADILSLKEALEFSEHVAKKGDFMITSCCCPMWVAALRKVYSSIIKDVSPSVSPMIAMGRVLKTLTPEIKVVFIGPCMAKKAEAKEKDLVGAVDAVLTFEELKLIFEAFEIEVKSLKGVPAIDYASTGGRLYARTGGVSQAVWDIVDQVFPKKRELFTAQQADGMKACKSLLEELVKGEVKASFIEGMGCKGGCVGGPKAIISVEEGKQAVNQTAYESVIKIPIHSEVLQALLSRLGIERLEELSKEQSLFERDFR